jgi:T-complex protein 1 subunit theta
VSFEVVPRILSENAGLKAETILANLYAEVNKGSTSFGIDVSDGQIKNVVEASIFDSLESKSWALKLSFDVVLTLLKVDQIIMSKPAGGPNSVANQAARRPDGYDE